MDIYIIYIYIYWALPPTCNSPKRRLVGGPDGELLVVNPLRLLQGGGINQI